MNTLILISRLVPVLLLALTSACVVLPSSDTSTKHIQEIDSRENTL